MNNSDDSLSDISAAENGDQRRGGSGRQRGASDPLEDFVLGDEMTQAIQGNLGGNSTKKMLSGILFMCLAAIFNVVSSSLVQAILVMSSDDSTLPAPHILDFLLFRSVPLGIASYILSSRVFFDTQVL